MTRAAALNYCASKGMVNAELTTQQELEDLVTLFGPFGEAEVLLVPNTYLTFRSILT